MRRYRTFRSQILLTLLGCVLLAEILVSAAILNRSYQQTIAQADNSLHVGNRVLQRLLALRADQLLSNVRILASDFGFKSAVATNDGPTFNSTLENFGRRADADIAILFDPNGKVTALVPRRDTGYDQDQIAAILRRAQLHGSAAGLVMFDRKPYQFIVVPVKAPRTIAWLGMGFQIDAQIARSTSALTGVDVAFVATKNGQSIFRAQSSDPQHAGARPGNARLLSRQFKLRDAGQTRLDDVLSIPRSTVMASYHQLARNLVLILLATLALSSIFAFWLARKLSEPLDRLSEFAVAVAGGNYAEAPKTRKIGEFNALSDALTDMQSAVRLREERIRHQATHDPLTGLLNRESIRSVVAQRLRESMPCVALRLSIQDFARINTALGYRMGDDALRLVSERIRRACSEATTIGRVEGNDFLVLMPDAGSDAANRAEIERLRREVEYPIQLLQTPIALGLEVGVLYLPEHAGDIETAWRRSVITRNRSRENRGATEIYSIGMDEARQREMTIIQDLAPALARNELSLVFQPKLDLTDGRVSQVEALSRWTHPTFGFVPPDEFIPLAERSGQIRLVTDWLVREVGQQLAHWQQIAPYLGVAVNISADELADPGLESALMPLIRAASPTQQITLEVTESALMRDPETAIDQLSGLQAHGARVAIDDFGTGFSSLSQLKRLAADELKIDKSFVLRLDSTPVDQFIVDMIIDLGTKLGMRLVAEGVENIETWRYLATQGAHYMQGYYLARPMPAAALGPWLKMHAENQAAWTLHAHRSKMSSR